MTWKFAQARPIGFSLGRKLRLQQLSFANGVFSFSDGNTQALALVSRDTVRHSSMEASSPSESAAKRTDRTDFGSPHRHGKRVVGCLRNLLPSAPTLGRKSHQA